MSRLRGEGVLGALGGEVCCRRLAADFYARVAGEPVLRPLFPGRSLRCATEEFAAFLIQFLGGDEEQAQHRWWLSLRESHARFKISAEARSAWLRHMGAALDAAGLDVAAREALRQFFRQSSAEAVGETAGRVEDAELAARWAEQQCLEAAVAAVAGGRDEEAIALARRFEARPSVFAGLLARMMTARRAGLVAFVREAVERTPALGAQPFGGRPLIHLACGAGCLEVVQVLLRLGTDANLPDRGRHTPLYAVANECATEAGPAVALALVLAGADLNACAGVTRATALHMAARRGHVEVARALLESGAAIHQRDAKGDTPLQRAVNCRRAGVVALLLDWGA